MVYRVDIDPLASEQIHALPPKALAALAEAFEVLELVPERGQPLNPANPTGGLYQLRPCDAYPLRKINDVHHLTAHFHGGQ